MFQPLVILLFTKVSGYFIAKSVANSFVSTNLNAILLMCPNDTNEEWLCVPQLIININFTPNMNVNNAEKLLILDETYEPTKRQTFKIMSPYIIIIKRSEPTLMFPLINSNWTSPYKHSYYSSENIQKSPFVSHYANNTQRPHKVHYKELRRRSYNILSQLIKQKRENPYIRSNAGVQSSYKKYQQTIGNVRKSGGRYCGNTVKDNARILGSPTVFNAIKSKDQIYDYSAFNLSTPFAYLAAEIRVFRKRKQTWWRITPVISLNDLSGTYANGNISALLTSHADIFQQRIPKFLENFQLLIPNHFFTNPKKLIGLRIEKGAFLELLNSNTNKTTQRSVGMKDIITYHNAGSISVNMLSKCPHNNKELCLNVMDDQVPAFDIKLKIPFLENAAQQNILKVKISRIVTDATTKDALQISVEVINKGLKAQKFLISVCDCALFESEPESSTTVQKILIPYISETITFLLPFLMRSKKNNKSTCYVFVKAYVRKHLKRFDTNKTNSAESNILIVSKRSMRIEAHSRCFCIWTCRCHCIGKIDTHSDANVCKKMSYKSQKAAGLLLNCPLSDDNTDTCSMELSNEKINHNLSSELIYKTIEIILLLFIALLLFVLFCCQCFKPRKEDLLVASTEWFCCPPDNNKPRTYSRYHNNLREVPSRSQVAYTYSNKYFMKSNMAPSADKSISPSLEASRKQSNQADLLESALITLTRQQKELRKQSMKHE